MLKQQPKAKRRFNLKPFRFRLANCKHCRNQVRNCPSGKGIRPSGRAISPARGRRRADPQRSSKSGGAFDLIVPVEAHVFDDAIAHHDDAALLPGIGDVLMQGERRDVDIIAARPLEFLRGLRPFPLERFEAISFQVPVQVVSGAFYHEE